MNKLTHYLNIKYDKVRVQFICVSAYSFGLRIVRIEPHKDIPVCSNVNLGSDLYH